MTATGTGSANAKVLLFGEHSVVFGKPAIALGLHAGVTATARSESPCALRVPNWNLDLSRNDDHPVARALDALLSSLGIDDIACEVDAHIPAGAGLGSSAALAVAVARAALAAHNRADNNDVAAAAMASERVFHGNPSGLDHTVAMTGGLLRFVRGNPPHVQQLGTGAPFSLVVAQVAAGASTAVQVSEFARRIAGLGATGSRLLDCFEQIVDQAIPALERADLGELGLLFDANHGLLAGLGMSTAALDVACQKARNAGAYGAKLTGAGGGGCVIALADADSAEVICDTLRTCSISSFIVHHAAPAGL